MNIHEKKLNHTPQKSVTKAAFTPAVAACRSVVVAVSYDSAIKCKPLYSIEPFTPAVVSCRVVGCRTTLRYPMAPGPIHVAVSYDIVRYPYDKVFVFELSKGNAQEINQNSNTITLLQGYRTTVCRVQCKRKYVTTTRHDTATTTLRQAATAGVNAA